jgi:hypothetical protein
VWKELASHIAPGTSLYVCAHVYAYMCACVHVYMCVCMHVYMYVCLCMCEYMCVCVCVHVDSTSGQGEGHSALVPDG